jgi:Bifunctional DNA primase/polymerase, N-terminal
MTDTLRHARMLLAFAAGAHSDRTNIEGHDLNQLQVSQLLASHGPAVVPSHGLKDGRCTCRDEKCKHPGRHPRTIHGLRDATTDGEVIDQFWMRWPKARVIVATGQQGIIAVTARGRKGQQALDALAGDEAVETLEFRGRRTHTYLVRVPEEAVPNGQVTLAEGVVIHGRGRFIVVPRNVTRPGRYKQLFDNEIALGPSWLLRLLGAPAPSDTPHLQKDGANAVPTDGSDEDTASSESLMISEREKATVHERPAISERTFSETLSFELKMLDLDWIVIPDGTPPCNEDKVRALAESYRITNVPAPLTVRVLTFRTKDAWPTFRLLSDPYELETLKRLGIKCAECFVVEGDTRERLWRLARLIHHPEVKCLDRALAVMEWVGFTREKGGQVAHPPGGKQPHDKGFSAAERVLGVSRRDLRRFSRIASISAEAQEIARGAGLDAIQIALEEIADEPPEQQATKALELKERYRKPRRNRAASAETNASTDAQQGPVVEDQPAPGAAPSADESDQQEEEQDDQQHPAVESPAIGPADASEGTNEPPSVLDRRPDEDEKFERFKFRWEQYLADDWEQETERFHRRFIKTVLGYSVMPMSKAGKSHG